LYERTTTSGSTVNKFGGVRERENRRQRKGAKKGEGGETGSSRNGQTSIV